MIPWDYVEFCGWWLIKIYIIIALTGVLEGILIFISNYKDPRKQS